MSADRDAILAELFSLRRFGMRPGLDTMREFSARLGNPERALRFVHLAGTNGKGSTASMIESVLRHAGYKTGLYTSPHLVDFGERIQVKRRPISPERQVELAQRLMPTMREMTLAGIQPTFFEAATAMALLEFQEAHTDIVVWETGMGGRLDATNIVSPEVAVITPISYDHSEWLGPTLSDIATEKAGILKNAPSVFAPQQPEAEAILLHQAAIAGSTPRRVNLALLKRTEIGRLGQTVSYTGDSFRIHFAGSHQATNAATAWETLRALSDAGWTIPHSARQRGMAEAQWTGRFQVFERNAQTIVVDGAHNLAGAQALTDTWRECFGSTKAEIIFCMLSDKDATAVVDTLAIIASGFRIVPVLSSRGRECGELLALCRNQAPHLPSLAFPSIASALETPAPNPFLVAGSLYLVGETLPILDPALISL